MDEFGKLKRYVDEALEMVLVFDKTGKIVYTNQVANNMLEYYEDEVDVLISDIFPEAFTCENGEVVWSEGVGFEPICTPTYRENKTCFDGQLRVQKLEHDDLTLCYALDMSAEVFYEHKVSVVDSQIESAEAMKTQFVANVTHELRTPVNGILGNIKSLMTTEIDENRLATMRLIERGCNDMHSLINNILDYSKLDAGKLELDPREFSFREMMEYVKSNHVHKIVEKGLDFFMNISSDIPDKLYGDELRIGQVLNNLLSNATKFTSTGKITVEAVMTAKRGNNIELFFMVVDTGIGISRENQTKLFKSFSQVEASTFRRFGGTGLGLNISKQLVEMMGGKIRVESEENKGSMFSFHIWVAVPEAAGDPDKDEMVTYHVELPKLAQFEESEEKFKYGTDENMDELKKKLSKLILSVEMKNWEKAEMFMEAVRRLTAEAPAPVKSGALKLKMAVQKADYDKIEDAYNNFKDVAGIKEEVR